MDHGEAGCASFRFSTRTLPATKRVPAMRDFFERLVQLEVSAKDEKPIEMRLDAGPGLRRAESSGRMP
jgi:hypothetical protein